MKLLSFPRKRGEDTRFLSVRRQIGALALAIGLSPACHGSNPGILADQHKGMMSTPKKVKVPPVLEPPPYASCVNNAVNEKGIPSEWMSEKRREQLAAMPADRMAEELEKIRQMIKWENEGVVPLGTAKKFANGNYPPNSFEWFQRWIESGRNEHELNRLELRASSGI